MSPLHDHLRANSCRARRLLTVSRDFDKFSVPPLDAIAAQVGDDPTSVLYLSEQNAKLIICPVGSIERGFHFEQEPHAILSHDCPKEMLGQATWELFAPLGPYRFDRADYTAQLEALLQG